MPMPLPTKPTFEQLDSGHVPANEGTRCARILRRLSQSLADALTKFQLDSRIAALAAKDIPDARLRLDHVLKMTEDAAHRTLDLIEQTAPLAESTANDAPHAGRHAGRAIAREIRHFLGEVQGSAERVRAT